MDGEQTTGSGSSDDNQQLVPNQEAERMLRNYMDVYKRSYKSVNKFGISDKVNPNGFKSSRREFLISTRSLTPNKTKRK